MKSLLLAVVLLGFVAGTDAHGSMIMPLARNSIDAEPSESPWSHGKHPETGWIEPYNCGWCISPFFCVHSQYILK